MTVTGTRNVAEPEVVYHYTTMETMLKIAQGASIWATSISYLNDISEGEHFVKLIRDRIPIYRETHPLEDEDIFKAFLGRSDLGFENRPFVASFSQEADSLPQWRSYCSNGNGVAIGFAVDCLKRASVEPKPAAAASQALRIIPKVTFKAIEYLDASRPQSLDSEISTAVERAILMARENLDVQRHRIEEPADYFGMMIEQLAGFKKHPSFSNEREYRLLLDGTLWNRMYLEFRPTRPTLVPYIPVHLPRESRARSRTEKSFLGPYSAHWDFIDRVVIGPPPIRNCRLKRSLRSLASNR